MHSEDLSVDGLLDTNIIVHAFANDSHSAECRQFVEHLADGTARAWREPLVLHETSYALPRYLKQMTRGDVALTLVTILSWPGVVGEVPSMRRAVELWAQNPRSAFVDAYLAVLAIERALPVLTKNASELSALGVQVLDPLPTTT